MTDDQAVERGARALADDYYGVGWGNLDLAQRDNLRSEARLVLEAATEPAAARIAELTAGQRPPNDYTGGPARTERELQLERHVAELEEHERERLANAQTQYTQAWDAWRTLLKRIGAAAGVELPDDLRYNKYEKQILAKIADLRAGQPNT